MCVTHKSREKGVRKLLATEVPIVHESSRGAAVQNKEK
jgi:hypothetical protein